MGVVSNFASQALRTLLVTYKDMTLDEYNNLKSSNNNFENEDDREVLESDFVIAGFFAL